MWYRNPFDQSELSKAKIRPRRPAVIRTGRDSCVNRPTLILSGLDYFFLRSECHFFVIFVLFN